MNNRSGRVLLIGTLGAVLAGALPASGQQADGTAILSVIPADCWGFVQVNSLRRLDDRLAGYLKRLDIEPQPLSELLETRLRLGPEIPSDGSLAVVLMPAETGQEVGSRAVILFPCRDVETWLAGFAADKIHNHLWRAELAWGSTWVGRKGSFAVFGATEAATSKVLQDTRPLYDGTSGPWLEVFNRSDINVWVRSGAIARSSMVQKALARTRSETAAQTVFGTDSILAFDSGAAAQVEALHVGVSLSSAGIGLTATILPQSGSSLAGLLAFGPAGERSLLSLLPSQPVIIGAAGEATTRQVSTAVEELDKLFSSPAVATATEAGRLARFRTALRSAMTRVRGGAIAVSTQHQGPEGLLSLLGVLKVDDAQRWMSDVQAGAEALGEGFFTAPAANQYYKSVSFAAGADSIGGVAVNHLIVELVEQPPAEHTGRLDYGAAWGPPRKVLQLAAVDQRTVALCSTDHVRVMADLIRSAKGAGGGLSAHAGMAEVASLLPEQRNLTVLFSAEELVRVGRVLARTQDKVERFPYRLAKVDAPIGAALTAHSWGCRAEIVIPADLAVALAAALLRGTTDPRPIEPPPQGL